MFALPTWLAAILAAATGFVRARYEALFADRRAARAESAREDAGQKATKVAQDVLKIDADDAAERIRRRVRGD